MYIRAYIYMHSIMCICTYIRIYACIEIYMYVYNAYIYIGTTYIYRVCIHTYIHNTTVYFTYIYSICIYTYIHELQCMYT